MINDMKLRRFAQKTQEAYVSAVAGLAKYYNQSPDLLDKEKIQAYLLHLMDERRLSWSTCNVLVCGIRFFYLQTLGIDSMRLGTPPMKAQWGNRGLPLNVDKPALVLIIRNMTRPLRKDYEGAVYHIIW